MRIPISKLKMLSPDEYNQIAYNFNNTAKYLNDNCIRNIFETQVSINSDKIAVIFKNKSYTFKEIDVIADCIANELLVRGIKQNSVVPVISKRSVYIIAAIFAILKVGAAFMLVDPTLPKDRIDYMIDETCAKVVLTYKINDVYPNAIDLDCIDYSCQNSLPSSFEIKTSPNDLCYVNYTSGSTGIPKGAMITNRNLVNFIDNNVQNCFQHTLITSSDLVVSTTKVCFDIFIFETLLPLLNGIPILLTTEEEISSGDELGVLIERYNVNAILCTPSKLNVYLMSSAFRNSLRNLKVIMIGAEELLVSLLQTLYELTDAKIFNGYGPTETTIGVSFADVSKSNN